MELLGYGFSWVATVGCFVVVGRFGVVLVLVLFCLSAEEGALGLLGFRVVVVACLFGGVGMLGRGLLFMDACLWLTSIPANIPFVPEKTGLLRACSGASSCDAFGSSWSNIGA